MRKIAMGTKEVAHPTSWENLLMHALEKTLNAQTLKDFRYLALQATQAKWYMKVLLLKARDQIRENCQGRHVVSYGYEKGRSASSVVALIRQALRTATMWRNRQLLVISIDVATCFDQIRHVFMALGLHQRGADPATVRAMMKEYVNTRMVVSIKDSDWSDEMDFKRGTKTGGGGRPRPS